MGISSYGFEDWLHNTWTCDECLTVIDLDHYHDIEAHIADHFLQRNREYEARIAASSSDPVAAPAPVVRDARRVMVVANYLRISDDLVEYTSAFIQEDGNVVISAAWFATLMGEAGWKARKS